MKNNFLLLFFVLFSLSTNAQLSVFCELAASPLVRENESINKNLSLGISYNILKKTAVKAGVNLFDARAGTSKPAFVDIFIPGLIFQYDFCALNHNYNLTTTSVFLGLQKDLAKFRFSAEFHRAFAKFNNPEIAVDESYLMVAEPGIRKFTVSYENISFNRLHLSAAYQMLNLGNASMFAFIRYSEDFIDEVDALVVQEYDADLLPYLSSLPGSNTNTVAEFIEGGDLNYTSSKFYLGVQFNYKLN